MSEKKDINYQVAGEFAKALGEKYLGPRWTIKRMIDVCNIEFAQDVLRQTQELEAGDGMMTVDGSRRRSPGAGARKPCGLDTRGGTRGGRPACRSRGRLHQALRQPNARRHASDRRGGEAAGAPRGGARSAPLLDR